MTEMQT